MYQGKRSVTQDGWKIQIESMKWGLKSKVSERSRTENCSRSFDRKSSRIGLPFDYGDSVRELFVHGCLPYKLELTTFLYVNQNPVTDFIVLVTDFIVGLPTLLLLDNNTTASNNLPTPPLPTSQDSLADPRCSLVQLLRDRRTTAAE